MSAYIRPGRPLPSGPTHADADSDSDSVLCFPHAGGCASFFRSWQPLLPAARVHSVQYPGREDRFAEPAPESLLALARAVAEEILARDERYSLLFGHSMGAYVAFEVDRLLREAGVPTPTLVLSSAASPALRPPVPYEEDADVLAYLERYEPLSAELRQDEELLGLLLEYVKDDLRLVSGYREHAGKRTGARLVSVVGEHDIPEIRSRAGRWRDHAGGEFVQVVKPGGHFYLRSDPPVGLIAAELARAGSPDSRSTWTS